MARSHTRDRERKGKGKVGGVTVGTEANFAARETLEGSQGGIVSRLPRIPDLKRSLPLIDVTGAFHTVTAVFFVATVSAIAADNAIQAGFNRGHRIFRFAQNPDLDHVAGFPVVARGFKAGGDHDTDVILVENESVQREPPTINSATQSARAEITRNAPIKSARAIRKGLRDFMMF